MGLIKGLIVLIASFMLFFSFIAMNFFLVANLSLDYKVIKPELTKSIKDLAQKEFNLDKSIKNEMLLMQKYCENHSSFNLNKGNYSFKIPCYLTEKNESVLVDYLVNNLSDEIYYKNYNCNFLDCFKTEKQPFFVISKHSKDYFQEKFYVFLLISILLSLIVFLFSETKSNSFVLIGILLGFSALPFAKLKFFFSLLPNIPFLNFFNFIFEKSYDVFLIILIIGIAILVFGVLLKFFNLGMRLSELINKLTSKNKEEKLDKEKLEKKVKDEKNKDKINGNSYKKKSKNKTLKDKE